MDPVTHTLIGAGIANAFVRRRMYGVPGWPILAVASNLPDVDALVHLWGDQSVILMRRTFGHSVFTIPIWSLTLALIFRRAYPALPLRTTWGLVGLVASVHVFFDLVNAFGVVPLWPVSEWRPEFAVIFIVDIVLTGFVAAPAEPPRDVVSAYDLRFRSLVVERPPPFVFRFLVGEHGVLRRWDGEGRP